MYSDRNRMRMRCCGQDDNQMRRKGRTPSFSSSLLDSICRSIDQQEPPHLGFYREIGPTFKNQSDGDRRKMDHSLKRAIMAEAWMEKHNPLFFNSASSSSDSSSGLFSSSETESTYRDKLTSSGSKLVSSDQKPKQDRERDGFAKTKLRVLKISPGGRISSFLNSIFSPGRKAKMCSADDVKSFSNGDGAAKRSVRFYPVSDQDSRHKEDDPSLVPTLSMARNVDAIKKQSINGSVEAAAREFLMRSYQKNKSMIEFEDEDDDAKSCASSDLFELDHLIGKYREELPVYETTSLRTNKAIAARFFSFSSTNKL